VTCNCFSFVIVLVLWYIVLLCISMAVVDCGRVEEITGSIIAEVDVPTSRRVLSSLDVVGTVGCAKLHVPKSKPVTICS